VCVKYALAIREIISKLPFVILTIGKFPSSKALFDIMLKLTYIILYFTIVLDPVKLNILERRIIDISLWLFPIIIVYSSFPMELVVIPLAFIGYSLIIIVKFPIAVHQIVLPLSLIEASFFIVKCAIAVSHPI
jgi:hypothetical protein